MSLQIMSECKSNIRTIKDKLKQNILFDKKKNMLRMLCFFSADIFVHFCVCVWYFFSLGNLTIPQKESILLMFGISNSPVWRESVT